MKHWVLDVQIVSCDEDGDGDGERSDKHADPLGLAVGENGVEHDAGRVDHREFVEELHAICNPVLSFWEEE